MNAYMEFKFFTIIDQNMMFVQLHSITHIAFLPRKDIYLARIHIASTLL